MAGIGNALYEASGLADAVDCFDNPSLTGCLKAAVNVGSWFVPGADLVRAGKAAVDGYRGAEAALATDRLVGDAAESGLNSFPASGRRRSETHRSLCCSALQPRFSSSG